MATNLYEILGITKDSTVEEIRRAYKKKALKTHPDRLPQGFTQEQKQLAEEQFRQVNHAYEILTSQDKRKEYDIHGVWPPPEPAQNFEPFSTRQRGFNDPFSRSHHYHHHHHHDFHTFAFRDPFELFNSIFGEFQDDRDFGFGPFPNFRSPASNLFNPFGPVGMSGLGGSSLFSSNVFGPSFSQGITSSAFGGGMSGNFSSESYSTSTVNGITTSNHKRRDPDGTEHVTKTYPDGRKIYTINGVEQPVHGHIEDNTQQTRYISQGNEARNRTTSRRTSEHKTVPVVLPRQEHVPSQSSSSRRSSSNKPRSQRTHQGPPVFSDPYEIARQHHETPTVLKRGRDVPPPQPSVDGMNIYRNDNDISNVPPVTERHTERHRKRQERKSSREIPRPEYVYGMQGDQVPRQAWWQQGFPPDKR